ncbi:VOC family protein [Entomohabitans teleogrylli]|uniref:VOC family protein n=1 Tax=Entomohabitans teleogrylli TaxID=1384589 RepID=UPI00073D23AB|nr:VOC family protein [Entomohabitans teleogrylli]
MKYNAAVWFEIYVDDIERATRFYEAILGVELVRLPESQGIYMMFPYQQGKEGAGGALVKCDYGVPGATGTRVHLSCADCAVPVSRTEENGGRVISPKISIGENGFAAVIEDTEGNIVGLHSMG